MSSFTHQHITERVRKLYERFPYPYYPIFAKPHWQDGYLTPSKFAARLFEDVTGQEAAINTARGAYVRQGRTILVAGAGEILPYVIRKNEPSAHRLLCVDLSQRSLNRARFRLLTSLRSTQFIRADINRFLEQQGAVSGPYDHIDAYGLLHHLSDPAETLRLLSLHLSGNGTMRLMIYNSPARHWIHSLQSVFRLLGLNPYQAADLKLARQLIHDIVAVSPFFAEKIRQIGRQTLQNDARFCDTFFHCREIRLKPKRWFEIFAACGLRPFALVDRYNELDHLPNPMWQFPDLKILQQEMERGNFANNLEIFLYKTRQHRPLTKDYSYERKPDSFDVLKYYFCRPPYNWFAANEASNLNLWTRLRVWHRHFCSAFHIKTKPIDAILKTMPKSAAQRLARLGAIFPSQVMSESLRDQLMQPLSSRSSQATFGGEAPDRANFAKTKVASRIEDILRAKAKLSPRRLHVILERLNRGQF